MRFNWFRRWLSSKKTPKTQVRQDTKAKPQVQQLEDRLVPATLIVNTLVDDTAADSQLSLREAINAVNVGGSAGLDAGALAQITGGFGSDLIVFNAPLAGGIITLGGTELALQRSVTIDGQNVRPVISGNGTSRIFNIDDSTPGAGITVNISNLSMFSGNTSAGANGGGILNVENLNLFQVTLSGNRADNNGGALYTGTAGTTNIASSLFVNNTAAGLGTGGAGGGAIFATAGTLIVRNTTITGNHGNTLGGGLLIDGTTTTITNVTIVDNQADSALGTGGGMTVISGTTTLRNSIVAGNVNGGGAVSNDLDSVNGIALSINSANNLIGDPASANGLVEGVNGNRIGDGANNAIPSSFIVSPLGPNGGPTFTHALIAINNRALDAGNTTLATNAGLNSDQRGFPFVRACGTVDMGAFELQTLNIVVDNAGDADDGNYTAGNLTLREAIGITNGIAGADTISFNNSLANQTITLGSDLLISDSVSINGLGADRLTISGNGLNRVFFVEDSQATASEVSISNLTITRGFNSTIGGAIVNNESLSLAFVELTNSTAGQGGGIANYRDLAISDSTLANNNASDSHGGAVMNFAGANLEISDSTLSGNSAAEYGAAVESESNATLVGVTVVNNRSDANNNGSGRGALDNFGLNFILLNTLVANNVVGNATTPSDLNGTFTGQNNLIGNATTAGGLTNGTNGNIVGANGTGTLDANLILNTTLRLNGGTTRTHALVAGGLAVNAGNATFGSFSEEQTVTVGAGPGTFTLSFNGSPTGPLDSQSFNLAAEIQAALNGLPTIGGVGGSVSVTQGTGANTSVYTVDFGGALAFRDVPNLTGAGPVTPVIGLVTNGGPGAADQRGGIFQRNVAGLDIGAYEAQSFVFVVNNTGDIDDGNYSNGNLTLREAVNLANANPGTDTINFNTSLNNQTITLGSELPITGSVIINGLGADRLTISGNGTTRIFHVNDGIAGIGVNAAISNMTLTQGNSSLGGAALNRENLSLSFVEITNSTAAVGGGIASTGNLTIAFSTLSGNNATQDGGAIANDVAGQLTVLDSTLSGNRANDFGSAIDAFNGSNTTLIHTTVVNNRADQDNSNLGDGALDNFGGTSFVLRNSIVAGNIKGNGTTPSDLNGNFAPQNNLIGDPATAGQKLQNPALPFNAVTNPFVPLTHGVDGNIVGNAGNGTLALNTILNTTLANNGGRTRTHALAPGSAAINAGNTTLATNAGLTTDQRGAGFNRTIGAAVDMGAFEVQDSTPPTITSVTSADANGTYGLGDFILVQVNFSENVTVTGTPRLTLETGAADAVVDYLSGDGTSTLTFEYQVGTGHASSDLDYISTSALALNNGTIRDGAGNNANLTLPAPGANGSLGANKNLVVDGVVPTVTSFEDNDADNVISVNVTQNYTVSMSADINNATVSAADFDNAGNATVSIGNVTYLGNGSFRVPVTPTTTGTVILRIPANATISDLAGNPLTVPVQDNDTITVTVNQAPVNVVPGTQTVLPSQFLLLSAGNGNSLSVNDDSASVSVNLQATAGLFTFAINYGVGVTGYNTANMTLNGAPANVQKTLDTLLYIAPNAPATATVTITSNDGALQDQDTLTINTVATKANVAPTITAPGGQNFTANTALNFGAGNRIQFGDIDSGINSVVVNLKANNGTLNLGPTTVGLQVSGQGTGNLTLTGRVDHLNYCFQQSFTYTPAGGFTGNDTLQITINDQGNTGTGGALTASQNITLTGPGGGAPDTTPPTVTSFEDNDADNIVSVNSTLNYTVTFNEAMNGTTITAADFNNAGNATISVGNVTQTGVGVYNVPVTPTSLGTIILRIPTGAVVQDVAGNNLTVPVQDNDTLTVTTNQPPVNTVPANQTVIAGSTSLFSVGNGNSLSVTDDSANVAVNLLATSGLLTFAVNYGVAVTGYNTGNMTVNGSLANVQKTLDTLFYIAPVTPGSANITITSNDGAFQDTDTFALTIVNPADKVNAAPTITTQAANLSFAANTPLAFNLANNTIQVGDIDAGTNFVSVNLKVNTGVLGFVNNSGLSVSGAGTGNLTLTGRIDHLNFSLPSLTYTANGSANDTLQININDLGNTGTGGAKTASQNVSLIGNGTVVVQNQAPVNTVPATATVVIGSNPYYLFSRGNLNAIQVADADLGAGNITVNLRSNAGFLAFAINYGVNVAGYSTQDLTINGPLAAVNNTLDTMFLVSFGGGTTDGQAPTVVVTTNDNGNTGPGGAKTDTDTIALTFESAGAHVNVAPTVTVPVDIQIGANILFSDANNNAIRIGDTDAGIAPVAVTLTVTAGTLNVANVAIAGTTVTGRGTTTLQIIGPVNLINYYLQTLAYTMDALPNADTLIVAINDLGNTGTGGARIANAVVAISRV